MTRAVRKQRERRQRLLQHWCDYLANQSNPVKDIHHEALKRSLSGEFPPTLRFYQKSPPRKRRPLFRAFQEVFA